MSRRLIAFLAVLAAGLVAAPAQGQAPDAAPTAMTYADTTPAYRFYPGDEIEISVISAPELSRTVTVAPDGRINLPLIAPMRAADMTAAELHDALIAAYARQLRTPELDVIPKTFGSRQVFVSGEVARPGIYTMPAEIDAFQAVTLAGGFLPSARRSDVVIMSRAAGGQTAVSQVNLSGSALRRGLPDAQPLQRYDVVYVPRSSIAHVDQFMQQYVRDALPVQFSLYYDLNAGNRR